MKGLLLKDIYMITKYCRSFIIILLAFVILSLFGQDNTFFVFYPVVIAGMIPVTLISYDEHEKWNITCETLPYTRTQFVSAKYLIGVLFQFAIFLLCAAAKAYRMLSNGVFTLSEFIPFILTILVIGVAGPSLLLPFIFKFGAEKGRIAYFVLIGAICAGVTALTTSGIRLPEWLGSKWTMILTVILVAAAFICSWLLSILFYKKREL